MEYDGGNAYLMIATIISNQERSPSLSVGPLAVIFIYRAAAIYIIPAGDLLFGSIGATCLPAFPTNFNQSSSRLISAVLSQSVI